MFLFRRDGKREPRTSRQSLWRSAGVKNSLKLAAWPNWLLVRHDSGTSTAIYHSVYCLPIMLYCVPLHAWHCWNKEILKQKCDASLSVLSAWSKIAVSWETKKKKKPLDWAQTNTSVCFTIDRQLYINIFLLAAEWQKKFNEWYRSDRSVGQLLISPISPLKPVNKPLHLYLSFRKGYINICNKQILKTQGYCICTVAYMSTIVQISSKSAETCT